MDNGTTLATRSAVDERAARVPPTLEDDVGSQMYGLLLAGFLDELATQLSELTRAATTGDFPAARRVAHQLNGTAPDFGAARLNELADRLLATGADQVGLLRSLVRGVEQEVDRLLAPRRA